jgi:hypothetical protein
MSLPQERARHARGFALLMLLVLVLSLFPACSMMFPHTELAIAPKGATLDALGIAILADIERWIDSLLFIFGLLGL